MYHHPRAPRYRASPGLNSLAPTVPKTCSASGFQVPPVPRRLKRFPPLIGGVSCENSVDNMSMNIRKTDIAATKTVSEFLVIQSQKLEDCGVEIEHFCDVFH